MFRSRINNCKSKTYSFYESSGDMTEGTLKYIDNKRTISEMRNLRLFMRTFPYFPRYSKIISNDTDEQ